MKKLFVTVVAVLAVSAASAQGSVGSWSITPKIGLNFASVTDFEDSSTKLGFAVGAEAMYQATNLVGISAGLIYSSQGVEVDYYGVDISFNLNYINVPILANFYVAKGLALKVGLQPGFLVSAKMKVSYQGQSASTDIKDYCKSFDLSLPVGISYDIIDKIVIDLRYNFGLTSAAKESVAKELEINDPKNSVVQFTVGYKFNLGK